MWTPLLPWANINYVQRVVQVHIYMYLAGTGAIAWVPWDQYLLLNSICMSNGLNCSTNETSLWQNEIFTQHGSTVYDDADECCFLQQRRRSCEWIVTRKHYRSCQPNILLSFSQYHNSISVVRLISQETYLGPWLKHKIYRRNWRFSWVILLWLQKKYNLTSSSLTADIWR